MSKKKQFYVVVHGHRPGMYPKWFGSGGAAEQVEGFPDPIHRGFYTQEEAIEWLRQFSPDTLANLAPSLMDLVESASPFPSDEGPEELMAAGKVLIYTDGASTGNPGPGGYGVVLRHKNHRKELSAGFRLTTNNRMELMACIEGLSALKHPCEVVLYSDSRYVVDNMVEGRPAEWQAAGWRLASGHKVKNVDLWQQLVDACAGHQVEFRWTRGHSGNPDNERCDQLATRAARGREGTGTGREGTGTGRESTDTGRESTDTGRGSTGTGRRLAIDVGFESTR
jgi:ribonuclease HI